MPIKPYVTFGTVTDTNNNVISTVPVVINNTSNNTYPTGVTNSQGRYVVDLANGGYTVGDTLVAYVRDGTYVGETSTTVTGENQEINITVNFITMATFRDKAWLMVYNHLQTETYAISENSIFSAMNDQIVKDEGYPIIIIEPPKTDNNKLTMRRDSIRERNIVFNIMVYAKSAESVKVLADEVETKLDTGWRSLSASGLTRLEILEGDYDWYTEGEKKIHVYVIPIKFRYVGK